MPTPTPEHISATVVALFRAHGALIDWGDRFVAPFHLTSARWQMLGALSMAGQSLTAPQIASHMGVTRQGAQKQLNLLLNEGLVEKLPNPAHKRSPLYRLTNEGRTVYDQIDEQWKAHARSVCARFSEVELAATRQVLESLARLHIHSGEGEPS